MNCKDTVLYALKRAQHTKEELVVGQSEGFWQIIPVSTPSSDMLHPSIIIAPDGIKYPEDEDRFAQWIREGR